MIYRSKAPLRLGLAGGGTDVSPYTDKFGGAVLNVAIHLFAHASIELLEEEIIIFKDVNEQTESRFAYGAEIIIDGSLDLLKGVHNYMQANYELPAKGIQLTTSVDTPLGSGLGTSSTLVVAIIGAYTQMLALHLTKYEIAALAYDIERNQLGFAGGRQDQYAATFGGINYMEFNTDGTVIVNPLHLRTEIKEEFENNLVLYYTGYSRQSGSIIKEQQQNVINEVSTSVAAMHEIKTQANHMRQALLTGSINAIGELFDTGFVQKRKMADGISNTLIENIYTAAKNAGATGGKISGAGGGGFMFFYCPANSRFNVIETLGNFDGQVWPCSFSEHGVITWTTE